jgi:hypothetical protein
METISLEEYETEPKFHDLPNPGEYWLGRTISKIEGGRRHYGHIVGFYRTNMKEVGITVLWENGEEYGIHPGNVDLH